VDAVITDPPYSSGGMTRSDRTAPSTRTKYATSDARHDLADFSGDNRDQRSYGYWCSLWLGECLRATRPGGVAVVFSDWRQLPTVTDALQAGGWVWRGIVPWTKPNPRPQLGRFDAQCEYAVWGSNGPMVENGSPARLPGFYEAQPLPARTRRHLAEKPLSVMRALARIVPAGGIILDPFMGSGTTASRRSARGVASSEWRSTTPFSTSPGSASWRHQWPRTDATAKPPPASKAVEATERLAKLPEWQVAQIIKSNPNITPSPHPHPPAHPAPRQNYAPSAAFHD